MRRNRRNAHPAADSLPQTRETGAARRLPPLSEASRLALRNLWHWRLRTLVLIFLTALAVASYLATSMFTLETMAGIVPQADIGLSEMMVVELSSWSYLQTRFLDDPMLVEIPRTETRLRPLITGEPGGELELLLANPAIEYCYVSRRVTLQLPWGTDELLSGPAALLGIVAPPDAVVAGRLPARAGEVMLPVMTAGRSNLTVGDAVSFTAIDPETSAPSKGELAVVGLYEPSYAFGLWRGAVGWLAAEYDWAYVTSTADHYPRILANFEPNLYVLKLAPNADAMAVARWLRETGYMDDDGCLHFHPRYPTVRLWHDDVVGDALLSGVSAGSTALGGIIMLSLSFVGVGALTMFLLGFLDRRREVAVLKTVGFDGLDIATVFGLEVAYTGILGLALGYAISYVLLVVWMGRSLPKPMVIQAVIVTLIVLAAAALVPIAMAGAATVTELLLGRRVIAIFRQRVSTHRT